MTYKDYISCGKKEAWLNKDYVPLNLENDEDNKEDEEDEDINTDNDIKIRLFQS